MAGGRADPARNERPVKAGGLRDLAVTAGVWLLALLLLIGMAVLVVSAVSNGMRFASTLADRNAALREEPRLEVREASKSAPTVVEGAAAAPSLSTASASPVWVDRPRPNFPWRATRNGAGEGVVVLSCAVTRAGFMAACEVVSENPEGQDFGRAAVAAAMKARVSPQVVDGEPTASRITFTVRFRMQ